MNAHDRARLTMERREETRDALRARAAADASLVACDADFAAELAQAEQDYERAYERARRLWEAQEEDDYRAQWASWAYGPDVNGAH